jgi:predicted PurR-regulated permease PerM
MLRHSQVDHSVDYLRLIQYVLFGSLILYFGRPLLIPLSFAVLISFLLYPICTWLESKSLSRMASIGISIFFISLLMIGIVALLFQQLLSFMHEWPVLRIKVMEALNDISRYLLETFNFTRDQQNQLLKQSFDNLGVDLVSILSAAIASSSASLVLVVLTPVFSALILYYRRRLVKVLYLIFPLENRVGIRNILMATIQAYYNFIKGMGMVYLIWVL